MSGHIVWVFENKEKDKRYIDEWDFSKTDSSVRTIYNGVETRMIKANLAPGEVGALKILGK
jgi:hypothetical protein